VKSSTERKRLQRLRDKEKGLIERAYRATEKEHEALARKLNRLRKGNTS
jgi:hypothetical protein